jgi:hypothetical protein
MRICRDRQRELQLDHETIDALTGSSFDGRKLLGHLEQNGGRVGKQNLSPQSFDVNLNALGLKLVPREDPAKMAGVKSFAATKLLKRKGPLRAVATKPPVIITLTREIGRIHFMRSSRSHREPQSSIVVFGDT